MPRSTKRRDADYHLGSTRATSVDRIQDRRKRESRAFDCCTSLRRSSVKAQRDEPGTRRGDTTYGTYIYPTPKQGAGSPWRESLDPTACNCKCCPHYCSQRWCQGRRDGDEPSGPSRRVQSTRYPERLSIDVVDRTQDGWLRRRHGPCFSVSLSSRSSTQKLLDFIVGAETETRRRACKVVVRWKDGAREPLDDLVPLEEVAQDARQIEVKDDKRVHWR